MLWGETRIALNLSIQVGVNRIRVPGNCFLPKENLVEVTLPKSLVRRI